MRVCIDSVFVDGIEYFEVYCIPDDLIPGEDFSIFNDRIFDDISDAWSYVRDLMR